MRLASRWSTRSRAKARRRLKPTLLCPLLLAATSAFAQLREAPGRAEVERLCRGCHEVTKSVSLRQDRAGWEATLTKMVSLGMKAQQHDLEMILDYLVKNYPADEVPPVNINKATAIELESGLTLKRSEAAAIIRYRTANGNFRSLADLKKVPGIDFTKIETKKDRLVF
jgi:competence protein ComEA